MTWPLGSVFGVIFETAPTRVPPIFASLPATSWAALGTSALTW